MSSRKRATKAMAFGFAFALILTACGSSSGGEASNTTKAAGDTTETTAAGSDTTAAAGETTTTQAPAVAPDANGGRTEGDGVLEIGTLLPITGDLSVLGPPMIQAVKMAIRDINAAGGVLGKPATLTETDDGTNEDVASASVDKLIGDKVDAIVGAAGSTITLSVIDKITGSGTAECSPSNTGTALTAYPDKGLYFRTAPPDNLQALALAELISGDQKSKVAIFGLNNDYGKGFAQYLAPALEDAGATVTAQVFYDPKGTSFDADVDKVIASKPDAVAFIGYPDTGGTILQSMIKKGAGPDKLGIYITDGLQSAELYKKVDPNNPKSTLGIRGTAPSSAPKSGAPFFPEAFKTFAPGVDTIFSAHAYDCAVIFALAADQAKSDAPKDIAANIGTVTKDGTKCTTYADCLKLIDAGTDIDYDGAAGPLDFSPYGEPSAGTYDTYTYDKDDGSYTTNDQVDVAG